MRNAVLIAHYDKDVSWIREIKNGIERFIYSTAKTDSGLTGLGARVKMCRNKGMDASMYLRFIIDNYENLPDNTLFLHHHLTDWSQDDNSVWIANNVKLGAYDYFSVVGRNIYWKTLPHEDVKHIERMEKAWPECFADELKYPDELEGYCGSLFCVSKKSILQKPKAFYQKRLEWVYGSDMPDWFVGRLFEWTWNYIFTGQSVEERREKDEIFNIKK